MSHTIDTVLRLKVKHRAGQLARLAQAIADHDGLIGEVATISVGEDDVVREVTIETHDDALSNPSPEIQPHEALAAGAAFAGDGRSINNALAFPGLVNGLLLARCRSLRPEMQIAAAEVIARMAAPGDLVPNPLDRAVHAAVTDAVRAQAKHLGLTGTCDLA